MKQLLRLAILVASFCTCASSMADVNYSFNGFFSNNGVPDQTNLTGAFTFTVADYIVSDADISPSAMLTCHAADLLCSNVHFYQDAFAAGLSPDPGMQAIGLSDTGGTTFYYYFAAPAFSTPGTYASDYNQGVLTVSAVPEPASVFYLLAGFGLIGAVAARRRNT